MKYHTLARYAAVASILISGIAWAQSTAPTAPKKDQPGTPSKQPANPAKPQPGTQPTAPTKQPADTKPTAKGTSSATTPVSRETEPAWKARNQSFNARAKAGVKTGEIGMIFIGDSITEGWEGAGAEVWDNFYSQRRAVNFGISGDRTQHVLWRLDHGNVEGLAKAEGGAPKLVVLMIGTNNSNGKDNTAEEIADGIKSVVAKLREKLPTTKVLMLAIFPRGEKPNPQREKINTASELASTVADGKMVQYMDIGARFIETDQTISKSVMPDALHLSAEGYKRWAEAIEPKVKEMLGEATAPAAEKPAPTKPAPEKPAPKGK